MEKYDSQQRAKLLSDYAKSEMSISVFCRQRAVNEKTFGNWLRRERLAQVQVPAKVKLQSKYKPQLIPIEISSSDFPHNQSLITSDPHNDAQNERVAIELPNGVRVNIQQLTVLEISELLLKLMQCSH